jgi:hypothetical protein
MVPWAGHHASRKETDVGHRPVFQRTEQQVPDDPIQGFVCGKIQDIDEVVPAWVEKNRMLIGSKLLRMDAEVLIDGANFQISIPQRGDPDLHADLAIVRRKRLLPQHDIDIERSDWKFEYRFLGTDRSDGQERRSSYHEQAPHQTRPSMAHDASDP